MSESREALREHLQEAFRQPAPFHKLAAREEKPLTPRSLFSRPELHPVILDLALLKLFGAEWFTWMPDTVLAEMERETGATVADTNKVKVSACMVLHNGEQFWEDWDIFEKIIHSLLGATVRTDLVQPPELGELYAGVAIANSLRPGTFSEEVARYCAAVHRLNEVPYAPAPLDFCQLYLSEAKYHCHDCETKGSALPPFAGQCFSCSGMFAHDRPLGFTVEAGRENKGKNVTTFLEHDPGPLKRRFEELDPLHGNLTDKLAETAVDHQAALLLDAKDTERLWETRLQTQLADLGGWLT